MKSNELNSLLGKDLLTKEQILFLIKRFNIIGFDKSKPFPNNLYVNGLEVFKYLEKNPSHISENHILDIEDIWDDIENYCDKKINLIKELLITIITHSPLERFAGNTWRKINQIISQQINLDEKQKIIQENNYEEKMFLMTANDLFLEVIKKLEESDKK